MTRIRLLAIAPTLLLAACVPAAAPDSATPAAAMPRGSIIASGTVYRADGSSVADVSVAEAADGSLHLALALTSWPAGTYGMHVHAVGRCEGPAFASAGPHWNPAARQHGRLNPAGTHHGDLPNLVVGPDGIVIADWPLTGTARGEGGLLDADGAAFVIHAAADDERTDPSGNSGARLACGVLLPR